MKSFILITFLFVGVVYCASSKKYTTRYNNIDLDAIMNNSRLLNNYFNCLITNKGCTSEGEELKKVIPDVLENGCEKCTDEQVAGAKKIVNFLIDKKPEMFKKLLEKYDPDKKYRKKWDAELRREGFNPNLFT